MLAVTTKLINRRKELPSVNAPKLEPLEPGTTIEVVETVDGDLVDGNNKWFKLSNGYYVWSGGIKNHELVSQLLLDTNIDSSFWVKYYGFDKLFGSLKNKLNQVRITLLDTGIDHLHFDLDGIVKHNKNFVWPGNPVNDEDGHGTHCAGILAGSGKNRITGVLPGIKLNIGKIMASPDPNFGGLTKEVILEALEYFGPLSDVISISAGIIENNSKIHNIIKDLVKNNVIIIAAIGNTDLGQPTGVYPAKYDECIAVGALDSIGLLSKHTIRDSKIDICFPGDNIVSTLPSSMGYYGTKSGTSMATPFIAGLVALMKAKYPSWGYREVREKLHDISLLRTFQDFSYRAIIDSKINI